MLTDNNCLSNHFTLLILNASTDYIILCNINQLKRYMNTLIINSASEGAGHKRQNNENVMYIWFSYKCNKRKSNINIPLLSGTRIFGHWIETSQVSRTSLPRHMGNQARLLPLPPATNHSAFSSNNMRVAVLPGSFWSLPGTEPTYRQLRPAKTTVKATTTTNICKRKTNWRLDGAGWRVQNIL